MKPHLAVRSLELTGLVKGMSQGLKAALARLARTWVEYAVAQGAGRGIRN